MPPARSDMTIARLAQAGGVGVETVRYYQRRGLLETPPRPDGPGSGGGSSTLPPCATISPTAPLVYGAGVGVGP